MTRRRGLTLAEVLIATAIAMVLALVALSLFRLLGKASRETTSSYLLSRDVEEAQRTLRGDLRHTALASVRIYPGEGSRAPLPPSLTCVTAQDRDGVVGLSPDGLPEWTGWLTYRLLLQPDGRARLVRTLQPRAGALATVAPLPTLAPPGGESRVLLTNLALPNTTIHRQGGNLQTGSFGGFHPAFLRLDGDGNYQRSSWNPAQVTAGEGDGLEVEGNTRLIEIRLALAQGQGDHVSYLEIPMRVAPRY